MDIILRYPLPAFFIVIFIGLMVYFALKGATLPYSKTTSLLTGAELNFYRQLMQIVPPGMLVFSKVRIADVLQVNDNVKGNSRIKHFGAIAAKHFDFVLVNDQTMDILGAIELNDKSHDAPDRKERDAFVRKAMAAAKLPLFEVKATKSYKLDALKVELALLISTQSKQSQKAHQATTTHVSVSTPLAEKPPHISSVIEQPHQMVNDTRLVEQERLPKPLASFIDLPIEPTTRN